MTETHPFGIYAPANARYLVLGSFVGKEALQDSGHADASYDWFYGTRRNQFWPILEEVYGIPLRDKPAKQQLFSGLGMAIADIIHQCERTDGNNLDSNLVNKIYNHDIFRKIPAGQLKEIFFTSRFVEKEFKLHFKEIIERHPRIRLRTLPSPSPRYARKSRQEKINEYRKMLPKLTSSR